MSGGAESLPSSLATAHLSWCLAVISLCELLNWQLTGRHLVSKPGPVIYKPPHAAYVTSSPACIAVPQAPALSEGHVVLASRVLAPLACGSRAQLSLPTANCVLHAPCPPIVPYFSLREHADAGLWGPGRDLAPHVAAVGGQRQHPCAIQHH